jgi:XTP/dITP diphosphohydrolase
MDIVIASTNVHEIRELRAMLKKMGVFDVYSLHDFPNYHPIGNSGPTFEAISSEKAIHAAEMLGMVSIASYSGLIVPSLAGLPGILSPVYAGPNATDKENRNKLLSDMKHLEEADRYAYLECYLTLATPDGVTKSTQGVSEGMIVKQERGSCGYGYDTLFLKHDYSKTLGELEEDTKNRISHIRKAFDKLQVTLDTMLDNALLHRRV